MKKLAIAMILCLSAMNAFSQQCTTRRVSAHKEMHMSSSVVVGTVTAAEPVPEAWDFLDGVNYTVHVESKIHGKAKVNEEVTVFSENSPRFFPMYVGQQYVLYLQPEYGCYQVDNCGNSHATDEVTTSSKQQTRLPRLTASRGF